MDTATSLLLIESQTLGVKTIIASFMAILFILIFYGLFRNIKSVKAATFWSIVGVITISTLVLLSIAIESFLDTSGGLL